MDMSVVEELERAGLEVEKSALLRVPIQYTPPGHVAPLGEEVPVMRGEQVVLVRLKPVSQLWTGTAVPPDLSRGPPPGYEPFFLLLEMTAADYCGVVGKPELDAEFERLYRQLRRRPDGEDANPLFSYLRAAARLYLSLRDVSRAEFEAVTHRLSQSARHFASHVGSTNYFQRVLRPFFEA